MEMPLWYKQSGFRFTMSDGRMLYIDPWDIPKGEPKADFIFISHAHPDHFDPAAIANLKHPKTLIIAPEDVAAEIETAIGIKPGVEKNIEGIEFSTVPAYNLNKPFHPKKNNWVGYILNLEGRYWYHAGDTDHIPEMDKIRAHTALLPIGGTYTMDAQEAAEAANTFKPGTAIPMHYGFVVGTSKDAQNFKKLCTVPVALLTPYFSLRH